MVGIRRSRFLAGLLAAAVLLSPVLARASLENEMRGMFNSMINVTEGGYYKALGRGVVAGPSVVIRNSRVRTDLINFVPPSIDAGCGGIDMFLGSFSFINGEQFVHLMQAIAANAAGYAFKLALTTMCPSCEAAIESLQKAIQKMNAMAGDSCQVAQAAVNFMADKLGQSEMAKQMNDGPLAGLANAIGEQADAFSAWLDQINSGTNTKKLSQDEVNEVLGNIAWKVLQKNGFVGQAFAAGDHELAEALMSFTGTVIGYKAGGDDDYPTIEEKASLLSAKSILEGSGSTNAQKKYNCSGSDCLSVTTGPYTFKGLQHFVEETLLGANRDAGSDSFIAKLTTNAGSLTDNEKKLIQVSPYHMTRLRNMAVCTYGSGVGSLAEYSRKAAKLIALEILQQYLREVTAALLTASQTGTSVHGHNIPYALSPKFVEILKERQQEVNTEFAGMQEALSATLEQIYQGATANCNLKNLTMPINGG
ncbi:MAG: conjugal transfer protein TraH [Halothiobacillaceae bacterium]